MGKKSQRNTSGDKGSNGDTAQRQNNKKNKQNSTVPVDPIAFPLLQLSPNTAASSQPVRNLTLPQQPNAATRPSHDRKAKQTAAQVAAKQKREEPKQAKALKLQQEEELANLKQEELKRAKDLKAKNDAKRKQEIADAAKRMEEARKAAEACRDAARLEAAATKAKEEQIKQTEAAKKLEKATTQFVENNKTPKRHKSTNSTYVSQDNNDTSNDSQMDEASDDATIQGGSSARIEPPALFQTRCTAKIRYAAGNNAETRCLNLVKTLFQQIKRSDKWACIAPWYEDTFEGVTPITRPTDFITDLAVIPSYFPRFMNGNKKDKTGAQDEYVSFNIGHSIDIQEILKDIAVWLKAGQHAVYVDMLQCERKKDAGFFVNSFFSMDLQVLRETIQNAIGYKVGLRFKAIIAHKTADEDPIKAIHVEVDLTTFNQALRKLSEVYGKTQTGFEDGRKMCFFASLSNVRSAGTRTSIKKAIKCQAIFTKVVKCDFFSDILHLDTVPKGSTLPTMRRMIADIKSINFNHLNLIHSVDETWFKLRFLGDYTYLTMPRLKDEADIMMSNLLPYLRFVHGNEVDLYFTQSAKEACTDAVWDDVEKRVICGVDQNAEEEEEEDTIGFKEALAFVEKQKQYEDKGKELTALLVCPATEPDNSKVAAPEANSQSLLDTAADMGKVMAEAGAQYYKDTDSISTLGTGFTITGGTTLLPATITAQTATQPPTPTKASSTQRSTPKTSTTASSTPASLVQHSDNQSVTSLVTFESFNNLSIEVGSMEQNFNQMSLSLDALTKHFLGDKSPTLLNASTHTKGSAPARGAGDS